MHARHKASASGHFAFCILHFAFLPRLRGAQAGSAIVYVMLTVSVLSVVAASLLLTNVSRYQTSFQSASWQEAIVGAEAGVDLAMNELRKRVITGPGVSFQNPWTTTKPQTGKTYANFGHAFPSGGQPYALTSHGGEGNTATQARVFVDVPGCDQGGNFAQPNDNSFISQVDNPSLRDPDGVDRSRWLFRVKSLGVTGVSGPSRPNLNKYDNRLRHFSFFNDWRTGRSVGSPQTARLVEAVVRPQTGFRNALMADVRIDLSNQDVLIDSYDSSKGVYSATNTGSQGNIATNGQLINANKAVVNGNAMTNNGTVNGAQNVTGQQSSSFYQELPPITVSSLNPAWSGVTNGGTVTTSQTYTASADPNNPTLVRLNGINLPDGGLTVSLVSPDASKNSTTTNTPSYIKVYVQGDISTTGSSYIGLDPNVNAIFYFTGNMTLQGLGIINNSYLASHLVLNGLQPTANTDGSYPARSLNVATTQDFEGIVYAPNYDLNLALQAASGSSSSSSLQPVVTYTGSNPGIPPLIKVITQAVNIGYNIYNDLQEQQAKYQKNGDQGAYRKMQQDQTLYNQQLAIYNYNISLVQGLGGTVTVAGGTGPGGSAEDHAQGYNGIYGGFVARTIKVANKTHVHYDETLRTAGPVNHYEIVNWFEDDLSRDSVGGPEMFWW